MTATKSQGSHVALEPSALSNGRVCLSSAMMHGFVGVLDMPAEAFHPDLIPVARIAREARENGANDYSDVILHLIQTTQPGEDQDLLRSKIADVANEVPHRPESLEGSAAIVRQYDIAYRRQKLLWKLNAANEQGDPIDGILSELKKIKSHAKKKPAAVIRTDCTEPPADIFDHDADAPDAPTDRIHDLPFRLLGVADGVHRYLPDNGMTVVSLNASGHTQLNLMQLAPLSEWETVFPAKDGCKWSAAANAMIQTSLSLPQYDPRAIRGRGCWIDGEDVIYHAGDKLAVNGSLKSIHAYQSPSRAIYEAGLGIGLDTDDSSRNADSALVIELCDSLSWDQPLFGKLLAGWLALAPISGALPWRPHVWISGASGSGKSWVMANIVHQLTGKSAIYCQGNTSEAGIRGRLKSDALPVLFDEAEAENIRAAMRMDGVIELARQSSSEGGGITKGTATGGSVTYLIRSMFCFASIGVAAVKKADTSRISVLNLKKTDNHAQFEAVKTLWKSTVAKPEFCARFRARSIRNAMTIRRNAETFSAAAVEFTGDKRSADQIGTLLAGAYSLTSTREITPEAAADWLKRQEWHQYKVDAVDADENQCLAHLFSALIRLETSKGPETITIDEAIDRARADIIPGVEGLALIRTGIRVDGNSFLVANQHQGLERIYRDTPWSGAKWRNQLLRVPGAIASKSAARFGPGVVQKAVQLPWIS